MLFSGALLFPETTTSQTCFSIKNLQKVTNLIPPSGGYEYCLMKAPHLISTFQRLKNNWTNLSLVPWVIQPLSLGRKRWKFKSYWTHSKGEGSIISEKRGCVQARKLNNLFSLSFIQQIFIENCPCAKNYRKWNTAGAWQIKTLFL